MLRTLLLFSWFSSFLYAHPLEGAGIQLFSPDRTKTLLVQGQSGRWGWTKGHKEPVDDTWLHTAIREVYEESGFHLGIHYRLCTSRPQQWGKRLYWQGITYLDEPEPRHNSVEHRDIGWVSIEELNKFNVGRDVGPWLASYRNITCDFD